MGLNLPNLEVLPIESLLRHEWHDDQRAKPLANSLKKSGVLRNPPIVSPLQDGSKRYMVLDGANRTTALSQLSLPHALCQVVDGSDQGLGLKTWNHVLWGWDAGKLLNALSLIPDTNLKKIDSAIKRPQRRWPIKTLVWLQTPDKQAYVLRANRGASEERAKKLSQVAEAYGQQAKRDRTTAQRYSEVDGAYEDLTAVVVYPPFSVQEVLELCATEVLLPPGITRFTISPRALRINYPLDKLATDTNLAQKNAELADWIQQRLGEKGIRYYSEATILFDE